MITFHAMKVIALGDIHGNLPALEVCYEEAEREGYDWIVHTGDVVGYGPFPTECVRFLDDRNIAGVRGNFDDGVGSGGDSSGAQDEDPVERDLAEASFRWTRDRVDLWTRRWLSDLPFDVRRHAGRFRMAVYHASPLDLRSRLAEDLPEPSWKEYGEAAGTGIVVIGHTHRPFHVEAGGRHFVNPGSVGRPRDGDPRTGYAVIETGGDVGVAFRRFPYDIDRTVRAIKEKGLPEEIASRLQQGM